MRGQVEHLSFPVVLLAVVLFAGAARAGMIYDEALVAHYEFEVGGKDGPAVLMGGAGIVEDAERGNVLSLDGEDDYVDCGQDAVLNFSKEITVACWVKFEPPRGNRDQALVSRGAHSWSLEREGGSVDFYCNDIRPTESITGRTTVPDRQWHHFAAVYDGSQICVYLDGIAENCASSSGPLKANGSLWIGARQSGDDERRTWRGFLDDVGVFSRGLSADEIKKLYNEGLVAFTAGPDLQRLGKIVQQAEAAVKEQKPEEVIAFLEKAIAEDEKWKGKNQDNAVFNYRRISPDLYFLLAHAKEAAGRPKQELIDAYKWAVDSDKFSSLSTPKQGPALLWLYEATSAKDYEEIVRPLIENNTDYLAQAAGKAEVMTREGKAELAGRFLDASLAAYANWQEQHPYEDVAAEDDLPKVYFQLARAKEATGAPKGDVADVLSKVFGPSRLNYTSEQSAALVWLLENECTNEYTKVIKALAKSRDVKESVKEVVQKVREDLERQKNWPKFELFLDTVFAEAAYPFGWAAVVESLVGDTSNDWSKRYSAYLDRRPRLKFGRDCAVAEKVAAEGKPAKAAGLYKDILNRYGSEGGRVAVEFELCKCLFDAGEYQEAGTSLESFIANNRAVSKSLMRDAIGMKGRAYLQLGQFDKAIESFFTLMMEYPEAKNMPEVAFGLGRCYMLQGNLKAAKEAFDCVVRGHPSSSYADKARSLITRIQSMTE
ncbi:MAG TPA: LamG-like jellyroll fold domain-containing protein [Sedimentisphaerales bacterium]|nr:LamG-like jellyroll fold domain-containing protein [Sedimentisphaerales bacterium]